MWVYLVLGVLVGFVAGGLMVFALVDRSRAERREMAKTLERRLLRVPHNPERWYATRQDGW